MRSKKPTVSASLLLSAILSPSFVAADEKREAKTDVLETVVVTATREAKPKKDLAESVTVFDEETIQNVSHSHPSELLNRAAGVYVNNLGGEGHMTAIRQPITTRGVYLFLEDGVPIRPTGFFNHNALYEVNIPQSGGVEVVKGPGSALYGSDAIGGMINALTTAPPKQGEEQDSVSINAEAGSYGWARGLLSAGTSFNTDNGKHGIIASLNYTENEGYRDESDYDRTSLTTRWDYSSQGAGNGFNAQTVFSYTEVNQSGISSLEEDDYKNDTKKNRFHNDVAFRDVEALRLSSRVDVELASSLDDLLSITPYYRNNTTTMAPSWMVTYDPNERESKFESFGVLSKYRVDFTDEHQLITGLDVDYSPSSYYEEAISHQQDGDIYVSYSKLGAIPGGVSYDFDAEQTSISPYLQYESRWADKLITTIGLRYDYFEIDYQDNLSASDPNSIFIPQLGRPVTHLRPEDEKVDFDQLSPKLGVVYQYADAHELYANYRHAFTIPSVATLFRSGGTQKSNALKPIKADSYELGFRGAPLNWLNYEVAIYSLSKEDDLVTIADGFIRFIFNAGETEHNGIELSVFGDITAEWAYAISFTETDQRYKKFSYTCRSCPGGNADVSGNDVARAPKNIGNFTIAYAPLALEGLRLELEWEHLGEYYTDDSNTEKYDGHYLANLRVAYQATDTFEVYGRVMNLSDELYSTYTSNQVGDPDVSYSPGLPRTYYAGVKFNF